MEKYEEIPTTKKVVHRYCDDCGKEIFWGLACSRTVCEYCGKQLCPDCIGYERETYGDYREVYCKTCSGIYKKHKPEMDKAYKEYSDIVNKMQKECKDVRIDK